MNLIGYKSAVSLYPNTTFIKHRSYLLPMTPRSWETAPSHPYIGMIALTGGKGFHLRSRPSYGVDEARDLGIDVERHMGDGQSWKLSFDSEGGLSEETGTQAADEARQCIKLSTWVMKFRRNIPKVHTTGTASNLFGPYP